MKLLTTIAAVLLSISAFSQDYVEYNRGTFTQNGEQLSMEQIDDLTLLHKAGRGNFRKGNRFNRMHKNEKIRTTNNDLNLLGGVASVAAGGFFVFTGYISFFWYGDYSCPNCWGVITTGTGLCVVSHKAFSRITLSKKGCLRKRDEQFNKVADKINQAIKAAKP